MSTSEASAPRPRLIVDILYYITAIFFFVYLFAYFWTSEGGPTFPTGNHIDVLDAVLDSIEKFRLVLQSAINVDGNKRFRQQVLHRPNVLLQFRPVPQRF